VNSENTNVHSTKFLVRYSILAAIVVGGIIVVVGGFVTMYRATKPWPLQPNQAESGVPSGQIAATEPSAAVLPPVAELISSRLETEEPVFLEERKRMLVHDLMGRDITEPAVLRAMGRVPRQLFVRPEDIDLAYADHPLPIGYNQTISQPYIVALMTQLARPKPDSRALDVGTGSGYQAAVLAEICKEVYSIEIVQPLAETAAQRLAELGYTNVTVRHGDGYRGWPEHAPFDVIIVAAAPDHIPQPLVEQLAPGGRLVLPVGRFFQQLIVVEKLQDGTVRQIPSIPVSFVPMTGEAEKNR
jgi:protein-L-isoaspartate(D-aspartate) O-methyltransferase